MVISEDTLPKLTEEKSILRKRLDKITSQLEDNERRLKEERTSRSKQEQDNELRNQELEASWAKVLQEKQYNWEAKEKALEEKVENQDRLLKELKANYEVSQRLGQNDESESSWQGGAAAAELEMAHADLEKTASRLADIEARNEHLRIELAQAMSQSHSGRLSAVQDDPAFQTLQSENSALLRRFEAARLDKDAEKHEWENKLHRVERQKKQMSTEVEDLKLKVEQWADHDELRRELNMIKSIEFFNSDDEDAAEATTQMANGTAQKGSKESLEQLLMTRNKKLSSEMTILRVTHQALQQQLKSLQEELSRAKADLGKSQQLTTSLENDLSKVQSESLDGLISSGMSVAGTSRYPQSTRRGRASPTSSIISGFDVGLRTPSSTLEALRAGEPVGGGSGILPMVQAQRDRFKQKNSQLEEELSQTYATVTSLRQEVASLQKDNLSLYEKTRYVSTYNRGPTTTSSSSAYSQGRDHTAIQVAPNASSGSLDRYKTQYEASISPFAAFRGRESARAYKRMSLPERVIFSITRVILANRTSRNLFAGYCLALHVLVFLMLYWSGTVEVDKHAANLGDAAAAAGAGGVHFGTDPSPQKWQPDDFHGN